MGTAPQRGRDGEQGTCTPLAGHGGHLCQEQLPRSLPPRDPAREHRPCCTTSRLPRASHRLHFPNPGFRAKEAALTRGTQSRTCRPSPAQRALPQACRYGALCPSYPASCLSIPRRGCPGLAACRPSSHEGRAFPKAARAALTLARAPSSHTAAPGDGGLTSARGVGGRRARERAGLGGSSVGQEADELTAEKREREEKGSPGQSFTEMESSWANPGRTSRERVPAPLLGGCRNRWDFAATPWEQRD